MMKHFVLSNDSEICLRLNNYLSKLKKSHKHYSTDTDIAVVIQTTLKNEHEFYNYLKFPDKQLSKLRKAHKPKKITLNLLLCFEIGLKDAPIPFDTHFMLYGENSKKPINDICQVSENLRFSRNSLGLSQQKLCNKLNVSTYMLKRYENIPSCNIIKPKKYVSKDISLDILRKFENLGFNIHAVLFDTLPD